MGQGISDGLTKLVGDGGEGGGGEWGWGSVHTPSSLSSPGPAGWPA